MVTLELFLSFMDCFLVHFQISHFEKPVILPKPLLKGFSVESCNYSKGLAWSYHSYKKGLVWISTAIQMGLARILSAIQKGLAWTFITCVKFYTK